MKCNLVLSQLMLLSLISTACNASDRFREEGNFPRNTSPNTNIIPKGNYNKAAVLNKLFEVEKVLVDENVDIDHIQNDLNVLLKQAEDHKQNKKDIEELLNLSNLRASADNILEHDNNFYRNTNGILKLKEIKKQAQNYDSVDSNKFGEFIDKYIQKLQRHKYDKPQVADILITLEKELFIEKKDAKGISINEFNKEADLNQIKTDLDLLLQQASANQDKNNQRDIGELLRGVEALLVAEKFWDEEENDIFKLHNNIATLEQLKEEIKGYGSIGSADFIRHLDKSISRLQRRQMRLQLEGLHNGLGDRGADLNVLEDTLNSLKAEVNNNQALRVLISHIGKAEKLLELRKLVDTIFEVYKNSPNSSDRNETISVLNDIKPILFGNLIDGYIETIKAGQSNPQQLNEEIGALDIPLDDTSANELKNEGDINNSPIVNGNPPPPPPLLPNKIDGNVSVMPTQQDLINEAMKRRENLKDANERVLPEKPQVVTQHSALMEEIKKGVTLKPFDPNEHKTNDTKQNNTQSSLFDTLKRKMQDYRAATREDEDDWSDSEDEDGGSNNSNNIKKLIPNRSNVDRILQEKTPYQKAVEDLNNLEKIKEGYLKKVADIEIQLGGKRENRAKDGGTEKNLVTRGKLYTTETDTLFRLKDIEKEIKLQQKKVEGLLKQ